MKAAGVVQRGDDGLEAIEIVSRALRLALPNPSARAVLGLKGLSEKVHEPLGWYLWINQSPGPYALELVEADGQGGGLFLVRCFPGPDSPDWERLSQDEQDLRASDRFDETGTPTQDLPREMSPDLFAVGLLELAPKEGDPDQGLRATLVSRPGWTRRAAWRLFDCLVCALCHHHGLAARQAASSGGQGEEPWRLQCALAPASQGPAPQPSGAWFNPAWWQPKSLGIETSQVEYWD